MKKKLLKDPPAWKIRAIVTLAKLAEYLDISTSLLAMSETGLRNLPAYAFQKLVDLEQEFEKIKSAKRPGSSRQSIQPDLDRSGEKRISKYTDHANWQRARAAKMARELENQEASYELNKTWLDIIDQKLADVPPTEEFKGDRLWLKNNLPR